MTPSDKLRQARADLVATLELLSTPAARAETLRAACVETGGTLIPPHRGSWGPHNWEIHLLDVYASGVSEEAAFAAWTRAATRIEVGMQEAEAA